MDESSTVLSAINLGYIHDESNNSFDLRNCRSSELVEFQAGYTEKGYFDMCKTCNGYIPINRNFVKAGYQKDKCISV